MGKVSSGKKKSGPPAHQNRHAFVHNRNSRKTKKILAMPIAGLCPACTAVLEWRKKYRKYKPLSVAKKCVRCSRVAVKEAYHIICNDCSAAGGYQCCKCLLPPSQWKSVAEGEDATNDGDGNTQSSNPVDGEDAVSTTESQQSEEPTLLTDPIRRPHHGDSEEVDAHIVVSEFDDDGEGDYIDDLNSYDSDVDDVLEQGRAILSDLEGLSDGTEGSDFD